MSSSAPHLSPVCASSHLVDGGERLRDVEHGERHEDAQAQRVEHRRRDLQVLGELGLPLGLHRVDGAAHAEDVGGDGVAGGVVGAHASRSRR